MTDFRCVAVFLWASAKMVQILLRKDVDGPSSGISTAKADVRAEEPRDLSVWVDDLREMADVRAERTETRPGIVYIASGLPLNLMWCMVLLKFVQYFG